MKKILIITDEKKSSLDQCNALANHLKKKKKIAVEYKIIKKEIIHFLPNHLIFLLLFTIGILKKIKSCDFSLVISCGRISAPYSMLFKIKNRCKNVHILDPYFSREKFDLILLPFHDVKKFNNLNNIVETFGTLVNKKSISKNQEIKFKKLLSDKKIVSCFIGGSGKSSGMSVENIKDLIKNVNKISNNFNVIYCLSRRTEKKIKQTILEAKKSHHSCYDYSDPNPYWYLIHKSDYFIVTQDSVSMISDCISTGQPVFIHKIQKLKNKIKEFTLHLEKKKIVRCFKGEMSFWTYKPINEAQRVSNIIESKF